MGGNAMTPKIEYDIDRQAWEANLPPGWRFTDGPHSLIEPATVTARNPPAAWKQEAKQALLVRLAQTKIVRCDCQDCQE